MKEARKKLTDDALPDFEWVMKELQSAIVETKESFIDKHHVVIQINDDFGYIRLKKHAYNEYNRVLLAFGNIERDKMLNDKRHKVFNEAKFKMNVENRMGLLMREKMRSSVIKKSKEKQKRKRIPIVIEQYTV